MTSFSEKDDVRHEVQKKDEKGVLVPLPTWAAIPCHQCGGEGVRRDIAGTVKRVCEVCEGKGAVKVNLDELKEWRP